MLKFYITFCTLIIVAVALSFLDIGLGTEMNLGVTAVLIMIIFLLGGINIVDQWNRRPYLRFGKYQGELQPGFGWINPLMEETLPDVNVYDEVRSIKITSVQTKDNVPLSFNLVLTTQTTDVRKSVVEVDDLYQSLDSRAQASANGTIRAHDLGEILGVATGFSDQILATLKEKVAVWGIAVKAIEIKDFKIEDEKIQQAIAMKARAQKEAEAEMTRAKMQKQIAEQLNEAAAVLDEKGWRLKGLEVLLELCRSANNNTILIPAELQSLARVITGGQAQ